MEDPATEETVQTDTNEELRTNVENGEQQPQFVEGNFPVMQGQYENEQITPENNCEFTPEENPHYEDLTAVDLRTSRAPGHPGNFQESVRQYGNSKSNQKETISIAQLIETFHFNDYSSKNSPRYYLVANPPSKDEYSVSNEEAYKENHDYVEADYSMQEQTYSQSLYTDYNNYQCWDAETNTEPVLKIDQGTQTVQETTNREVREVSVQTEAFTYAVLENAPVTMKYICALCQRDYSSKSSYDRHLRTHNTGRKMVTDVRFTTQAKLQIYKRQMAQSRPQNSIVIQMPRRSFEKCFDCDLCERCFSSQTEHDAHKCIVEPFPMTKCPYCPNKYYTTGGLNCHIRFVHKTVTVQNNSQYYCVFCNESFETDNFHQHLDNHLSP